jgi:hypothetical protein
MEKKYLIFGNYLLALALGMLPIVMGLKSDWYVIPLVVFNFLVQFVLATIRVLSLFSPKPVKK